MFHQLRVGPDTWLQLPPTTDYTSPGYIPNQEQKQTNGAQNSWVTRGTTPGMARLKMKLIVSGTTPQNCEDEVERLYVAFRAATAFRDGIGQTYLLINGLPIITPSETFRGRCNRSLELDWPLLNPYWHMADNDSSTRLSPG